MQETSNGIKFTFNGHPSEFMGYVAERHPTMPSMAKRFVFDCRTKEIRVTDYRSAGNISIFAIIDGQEVQVLPYGLDVIESLQQYKK